MESLKAEICGLVRKLEKEDCAEKKVEALVVIHLKRLLQEMNGSGKSGSVNDRFSELRQYWLDSVPWCSELSKDIEKLIIMHGDLMDAAKNDPDPR